MRITSYLLLASYCYCSTSISDLLKQGQISLASEDYENALSKFSEVIQLEPDNSIALFSRATANQLIGRYFDAIKDLDKILSIKPQSEQALTSRARLNLKHGYFKESEEDARKWQKINPSNEEANTIIQDSTKGQLLLANIDSLIEKDDFAEVLDAMETIIRIAPSLVDIRKKKALFLIKHKRYLDATIDLASVAARSSGDRGSLLLLAELQFFLGEQEQGKNSIKKCLHSDQEYGPCLKAFRNIKNLDKQIKQFENLIQETRPRIEESIHKLKALESSTVVTEDFQSGMVQSPSHKKQMVFLLCKGYGKIKLANEIIYYCGKALEYQPDTIEFLITRGYGFIEEENYSAAKNDFNRARELDPRNQQVHEALGKLQKLERIARQKDYYKILGVGRKASPKEIRKAYRRMVKEWHPDKHSDKEQAEKKMAEINEAYEILKNEELRERYDNGDNPNDPYNGQDHGFQGNPFEHFQGFPFGGGGGPFGGGGAGGPFQFHFQF